MLEAELIHRKAKTSDACKGLNVRPRGRTGPMRAMDELAFVSEVDITLGGRGRGINPNGDLGEVRCEPVWAITMEDVHKGIPNLRELLLVRATTRGRGGG